MTYDGLKLDAQCQQVKFFSLATWWVVSPDEQNAHTPFSPSTYANLNSSKGMVIVEHQATPNTWVYAGSFPTMDVALMWVRLQ